MNLDGIRLVKGIVANALTVARPTIGFPNTALSDMQKGIKSNQTNVAAYESISVVSAQR